MACLHAQARWFYDGHWWHSQQAGTYDSVRRVVTPRCGQTPLPAIHFAYELGQGRRCRSCATAIAQGMPLGEGERQ